MDTEGGGTGAGQAAQPVRDGLTRLQGTERNTAAHPHKGRGGTALAHRKQKRPPLRAAFTGVTQPDYRAIFALKFRVPNFSGLAGSV